MPTVSPITKSPVARYLTLNNAIAKPDKYGCDFVTKEGLYLGRMMKSVVDNYTVYKTVIMGVGFKAMFIKSVAIGQQFAYIKNEKAKYGVSLMPVRTMKREILVDFLSKMHSTKDTEITLDSKIDLIAQDESTGVGLFEVLDKFRYGTKTLFEKEEKMEKPIYSFLKH